MAVAFLRAAVVACSSSCPYTVNSTWCSWTNLRELKVQSGTIKPEFVALHFGQGLAFTWLVAHLLFQFAYHLVRWRRFANFTTHSVNRWRLPLYTIDNLRSWLSLRAYRTFVCVCVCVCVRARVCVWYCGVVGG